jgi:asparagine synthase (glutamine-hydrolysing)
VKKDCPPNKNPVGCFVSGGLGSAGIAYALTKNKEKTFAYSTFFENETREDLKAAEKIVTTLKIPHFTNKISVESFFNNLIPILWDLEEPIGDPNIVATYELTCLAENKTPLVFSGMGSDELLAAHNRYTVDEVSLSLKERWKQFFSPFVNHGLIPFFKIFYKPLAYKLIKSSKINPWQYQYLEHNTIFNKEELSQLAPNLVNLFDPEIFLNRFEVLSTFSSKISSYLYIDLKTRLVDAYIFQYSKLCNAKGIEWRTPYFDQPLVEFLISLHEPQNQKGLETSVFLKKLFENIYPKEVVNRPKVLRSHFLESWLKKKEVMEIFELLKGGYLVENGLISKECLNSALSEKNSWDDMFRSLFTLLVLEIWIRLFITESLSEFSKDISLRELLKR